VKNKISSGTEKINGEEYQYCVFSVIDSSGDCRLAKGFGRILGANNN